MSFTPEQITEILQIYFDNFVNQTYTGMRYVPIFGRRGEASIDWDNSEPYEPLTIVIYNNESYTSRQFVPAGVAITDTDYWAKTGAYNAQIIALQDALPIAQFDSENTVKDYIDELGSFLPASDFDNDNTVKAYIDGFADLLPSSAFDSVNTVRGALNGRVRAFETVADMAAATDLAAYMICHTNGFHTSGDGGAAFYEIKSSGTANAMDIIACQDSLLAHLVITEPFVTPEMFGAYGDGTHDDTSVLQYVFNGNILCILKNNYLITDTLDLKTNIYSINNASIKTTDDQLDVFILPKTGCKYITGIVFNCSSNTLPSSISNKQHTAIYIDNLSNSIKIYNCIFDNVIKNAIYVNGMGNNVEISKCVFNSINSINSYSTSFITLASCTGNTAIFDIENNTFTGSGVFNANISGISLSHINIKEVNINNNTFVKCGRNNSTNHRLCVVDLYFDQNNINIFENKFIDSAWSQIRVHGGTNIHINDNYFGDISNTISEWCILVSDSESSDGLSAVGCNKIYIENNTFDYTSYMYEYGIELFSAGAGSFNIDNVFIKNNISKVYANKGFVYTDESCKNIFIENNNVDTSYNNKPAIMIQSPQSKSYSNAEINIVSNILKAGQCIEAVDNSFTCNINNNTLISVLAYCIRGNGSTNSSIKAIGNILSGVNGIYNIKESGNNMINVSTTGISTVTTKYNTFVNGTLSS